MSSNQTLTEQEARKLANEIRGNLLDLEKNLKHFHAVQGWLPLGYDSLTTWWDNEMRDLPIANVIRNWAAVEMIRENMEGNRIRSGMTQVMAHATGLAPSTISGMKSRARPKVRTLSRKDDDLATFSMVIPERWRRHLLVLSARKDKSMADILRPIIKEGLMKHYGVDLDRPLYESE